MKTVKIPMLEEFKAFAMRGNVVDLAVGVIIGAAFGKIVSAVVSDVIMPPIARLVGNIDFTNLYLPLSDKVTAGAGSLCGGGGNSRRAFAAGSGPKSRAGARLGRFRDHHVEFCHRRVLHFSADQMMNKLTRHHEAVAPPTPTEQLLTEIRDLLKNRP